MATRLSKLIFTLLTTIIIGFISYGQSNDLYDSTTGTGWKETGIFKAFPATFLVSSKRYKRANLIAVKGLVVKQLYTYQGDRIYCKDCDYDPKFFVYEYVYDKKLLTKYYTVWEVQINE